MLKMIWTILFIGLAGPVAAQPKQDLHGFTPGMTFEAYKSQWLKRCEGQPARQSGLSICRLKEGGELHFQLNRDLTLSYVVQRFQWSDGFHKLIDYVSNQFGKPAVRFLVSEATWVLENDLRLRLVGGSGDSYVLTLSVAPTPRVYPKPKF